MDELKAALAEMERDKEFYLSRVADHGGDRHDDRLVDLALEDYAVTFRKAVYIAKKMGGPNG